MISKNCVDKKLNKPFKSNRQFKKYQVCVKDTDGSIKNIHFGDVRYKDFTQHKDSERKRNYLKRSAGIKDSSGKLTKDNKLSANYWARKYLWSKSMKGGM